MTIDPNNLLKMLGLSARVGGASKLNLANAAGAGTPAPTVQEGQFAELLNKARTGELNSNKPVAISPEAAGKVKLTEDQLAKISVAADKAEAEGLRKALVVMDDQQVVLDVANRTITAATPSGPGGVVSGVDGVINLSTRAATPASPVIPPPAARVSNASLAKLLAEQTQAAA